MEINLRQLNGRRAGPSLLEVLEENCYDIKEHRITSTQLVDMDMLPLQSQTCADQTDMYHSGSLHHAWLEKAIGKSMNWRDMAKTSLTLMATSGPAEVWELQHATACEAKEYGPLEHVGKVHLNNVATLLGSYFC